VECNKATVVQCCELARPASSFRIDVINRNSETESEYDYSSEGQGHVVLCSMPSELCYLDSIRTVKWCYITVIHRHTVLVNLVVIIVKTKMKKKKS
jgi:hypothetical protein